MPKNKFIKMCPRPVQQELLIIPAKIEGKSKSRFLILLKYY